MRRGAFAALLLLAAAGRAQELTPPKIPKGRAEPRWERLLDRHAAYLVRNVPAFPIPSELEHSIRPLTGTALALATCLQFTACSGAENARATALRLLAEVTRTHVTGGGATASGRPWGNHWQSAFWAGQAAAAAWLLWPDVPAGLRQAVVKMMVHEADRFLDLPAPYARFYDTKAEENAWNSTILVMAAETLAAHPHRARWRARALEYMLSAFAAPGDRLPGVNIHADFTLENHGFVHPDYMSTFTLILNNAVVYRLLGRPLPQAMLHNAREVYANLKLFSLPGGGLLYPSGTDWTLHRADMIGDCHIKMSRIAGDAQAGALAADALATLEAMQARHADGHLYAPGEFVTYPGHEQHAGWLLATTLMTAKLWDPPPAAAAPPPSEARMLDDARMFVARTPRGVSAFSWGLKVMGITAPWDADPMVNPLPRSYVGIAGALPQPDMRPSRLGAVSASIDRVLAADALAISGVVAGSEAGALHVTVRGSHAGRAHTFSFTALPGGESVYIERWSGQGPAASGLVSLLQEPGWVHGNAQRRIETDNATWLNADNRLGYAVSGGGGIRQVPDLRSLHLVLNAGAGGDAAIVTLPRATVGQTRDFAARAWRLETADPDAVAVEAGGFVVVTNLNQHPRTVTVTVGGKPRPLAVSTYSTRVFPAASFPQ